MKNNTINICLVASLITIVNACYINEEIDILREYLRIPSIQPDIDYGECVSFLKRQAENLRLPVKVIYPGGATKPIIIITWVGQNPNSGSILLNSHMDIASVNENDWEHSPFAAEIDAECKIFARGSQDMKSIGMQHLAAIRALKESGVKLNRTIHITFVPDEELGGALGMGAFVKTKYFKKLNITFGLDESYASPIDKEIRVSYAEKTIWKVNFKISGQTGHGSMLFNNTVGEKLSILLSKFYDFRNAEQHRLNSKPSLGPGKITSINLTKISGGKQWNVIPSQIEVMFDIRVAVDANMEKFLIQLEQWCVAAGSDIEIEFITKNEQAPPTKVDNSNIFWLKIKEAVESMGFSLVPQIVSGATDARYLRQLGIPVLGFSPIFNTPPLLHENNEFIYIEIYLQGIEIFKNVIQNIGNI